MRDQPANRDRAIARIAARQHGVVSTAQLRAAGLDKRATSRRVHAGRLHRLHRGVYAVGYPRLTFEGRCMAAALACGEGAVVSHGSAAALWGMLRPHTGSVEITLPTDAGRKTRPGIALHRSPAFIAGSSTRRHGVPVTKPARTLRDLHRALPQPVYRRAVRRALDLRLISSADLKREEDLTRSELERLFLSLCRRHHLPQPEVNVRVGDDEVDFLWRSQGVIVETDGYRHHGDRAAFEAARARDARFQSLGYRVLRFTWRQLRSSPGIVTASLRAVLDLQRA